MNHQLPDAVVGDWCICYAASQLVCDSDTPLSCQL